MKTRELGECVLGRDLLGFVAELNVLFSFTQHLARFVELAESLCGIRHDA